MKTSFLQLISDESGATLVEYGLIVSLIAIACIGAITLLGGAVQTQFTNIKNAL